MKVEITNNGQLTLPLEPLLDLLSLEDKLSLADYLACSDDVIKYVGQQIVDRWTEHGSYGPKAPVDAAGGSVLDIVTREVAMKSSAIAEELITDLRKALATRRAEIVSLNTKIRIQEGTIDRLEMEGGAE